MSSNFLNVSYIGGRGLFCCGCTFRPTAQVCFTFYGARRHLSDVSAGVVGVRGRGRGREGGGSLVLRESRASHSKSYLHNPVVKCRNKSVISYRASTVSGPQIKEARHQAPEARPGWKYSLSAAMGNPCPGCQSGLALADLHC